MPQDMKEYNRNYYAAHTETWRRNYAKNIDARRESARKYANKKWEIDADYRSAHTSSTIRRTRLNRRAQSVVNASEKIFNIMQKFLENFE